MHNVFYALCKHHHSSQCPQWHGMAKGWLDTELVNSHRGQSITSGFALLLLPRYPQENPVMTCSRLSCLLCPYPACAVVLCKHLSSPAMF